MQNFSCFNECSQLRIVIRTEVKCPSVYSFDMCVAPDLVLRLHAEGFVAFRHVHENVWRCELIHVLPVFRDHDRYSGDCKAEGLPAMDTTGAIHATCL